MLLPFITLLAVAAVTFFLIRRNSKSSARHTGVVPAAYGIAMTEQETALERQFDEEIMKLLEVRITASGYFRAEKIPKLMTILGNASVAFGRTNTQVAFAGDAFVTVEEKKKLGLSTRMKYSKDFIEYFDPSAFKTIEPKSALKHMHLDVSHRVSRKRELLRAKELGFIKQIRISPVGDEGDCARIKRLRKIHNIDAVPQLPLPDCDAPFCRCMYLPIVPRNS
jgi:hypothetical protein